MLLFTVSHCCQDGECCEDDKARGMERKLTFGKDVSVALNAFELDEDY